MKSEKWRMENAGGAPGGTSQTPSGKSHQQPFGKVINRRAKKLSTGAAKSKKKKSPFKNTLKKKNDGDGNIYYFSIPSPRARARARVRARFFDPAIADEVDAAVDEAMAQTGGSARFRRIWCFYCLRLGINTFLDQLDSVMSCARQGEIRYPAQAFHARLRRIKGQIDSQTGGTNA